MLFQMVSLVLDVVAGLIAGTCLLRFLMQWQRISFHQPLGQFVFAVTDWLLLPLRRVVPPWSAWDLSSLVGAFLIKLLQYTLLWLVAGGHGALGLLPLVSLVGMAQLVVSALSALVPGVVDLSTALSMPDAARALPRPASRRGGPSSRWLRAARRPARRRCGRRRSPAPAARRRARRCRSWSTALQVKTSAAPSPERRQSTGST